MDLNVRQVLLIARVVSNMPCINDIGYMSRNMAHISLHAYKLRQTHRSLHLFYVSLPNELAMLR